LFLFCFLFFSVLLFIEKGIAFVNAFPLWLLVITYIQPDLNEPEELQVNQNL